MSMCKFFLQGSCRFGESCRFSHQYNTGSNFHSQPANTNIFAQQNTQPQQQKQQNVDTNMLLKAVATDMTNLEKSGQWLLSVYAPFKEKPEFPGFQDYSFEEIRLATLDAQKNGTFTQYIQQLQALFQEHRTKFRALQYPTPEIIAMLTKIYNTPVNNPNNQTFGGATTTQSIFGGNTASNASQSVFGANNTSQSIFGNTPTSPQGGSIFGGAAPPATGQNIFTSPSAGQGQSIFGNSAVGSPQNIFANAQGQAGSIFAQSPPQVAPQNLFTAPQQQGSIFNQQQTNMSTALNNSGSIFGQQMPQSGSNFAQPNVPPFGAPQAQPFIPNVPQPQQQAFAPPQVQNTQSIFAQNAPPQNQTQGSIFGNSQNQATQIAPPPPQYSVFGGAQPVNKDANSNIYSKLEDLSQDEIQWFKNMNDLDITKIPDNPPTFEMCF